jgi:hypothetical protein
MHLHFVRLNEIRSRELLINLFGLRQLSMFSAPEPDQKGGSAAGLRCGSVEICRKAVLF